MSSSSTAAHAALQKTAVIGDDEAEVLEVYRRAKQMGYADISITIQEGSRVKLWLTEKIK